MNHLRMRKSFDFGITQSMREKSSISPSFNKIFVFRNFFFFFFRQFVRKWEEWIAYDNFENTRKRQPQMNLSETNDHPVCSKFRIENSFLFVFFLFLRITKI